MGVYKIRILLSADRKGGFSSTRKQGQKLPWRTMETASQVQETDNPDYEIPKEIDFFETEVYRQFEAYFIEKEDAEAEKHNLSSQSPANTTSVKAKDQSSQSEAWKKQLLEEADVAKKQLAEMSEKLQDSHQQLDELDEISASVGSRLEELRRISLDQLWESELVADQKRHSMDSAAALVGVTVQLDLAQAAIVEMEAKFRRLREQSVQWRREVEVAEAMLSGNYKLNFPYSEYLKEDSPKKKNRNMLKKFGVFMKKGQKLYRWSQQH